MPYRREMLLKWEIAEPHDVKADNVMPLRQKFRNQHRSYVSTRAGHQNLHRHKFSPPTLYRDRSLSTCSEVQANRSWKEAPSAVGSPDEDQHRRDKLCFPNAYRSSRPRSPIEYLLLLGDQLSSQWSSFHADPGSVSLHHPVNVSHFNNISLE